MRTRRFPWLIGLVILLSLALSSAGLGDQVEAKDGRLFKGTIQSGVPALLSIDEAGVIVNISKDMIKEITKEAEGLVIVTATDDVFRGKPVSDIPTKLVIKTRTGVVEIKQEDIATITFPRRTLPSPAQPHEIELKDERRFGGRIIAGIPDPLSIDVAGIVSHIDRDKIRELRYQEQESIIETVEDEVLKGQIITAMPEEITLETRYGALEIKQADIAKMVFKKAVALTPTVPMPSNFVLGGGLSMLIPISELTSMLSLAVPLYGGSIEFALAPRLGVRAEVGYSSTWTTLGTTNYNFEFLEGGGKLILYLSTDKIKPYIAAGVGLIHISVYSVVESGNWLIVPVYSGSLGVSLDLFAGLSAYAQAELPYLPSPPAGSGTMPLILVGAGMSYSF